METKAGLSFVLKNNAAGEPNSALLETLRRALPEFFDADGNFKRDKFDAELRGANIAETRDGYKLGFVGKDYARLQTGLRPETMLAPDTEHNSKTENAESKNIFITGDNLEALRHLQNAYSGKVKMIYIDPPYNTGKEFVYNDKFEFDDEKLKSALGYSDEKIARLKSIQGKSSHSAWLAFMYPRLKLAQKLLSDDGVIFVSIDDNEQANLKLLMDDIFGEGNFVNNLIWQKKVRPSNKNTNGFSKTTEYVIFYKRQHDDFTIKDDPQNQEYVDKIYKNPDNDNRGVWRTKPLWSESNTNKRKTLVLPDGQAIEAKWFISQTTLNTLFAENKIYKSSNGTLNEKLFLSDGKNPLNLLLAEFVETTEHATKYLKELFGTDENVFTNPKPVKLIKYLLDKCSNKDSLILDFFAGSATTAHAVMQLNAEDGGNRKWILVQLDEPTNPDSEARKAGYNTIDEIARERIKRAARKITAEITDKNRSDADKTPLIDGKNTPPPPPPYWFPPLPPKTYRNANPQ